MILFDQVEYKGFINIQWDLTALRLNNTKWEKYIEAMEKYENTKDLQNFSNQTITLLFSGSIYSVFETILIAPEETLVWVQAN